MQQRYALCFSCLAVSWQFLLYSYLSTPEHGITFTVTCDLYLGRNFKTLKYSWCIHHQLKYTYSQHTLWFQKYEFNYVWAIWNLFYGRLAFEAVSPEPARRALTQHTGFLDPVNFGEIHYSESGKKQSHWMTVFTPCPPEAHTPSDPRQSVNMRVKYVCAVRCS